MEEQIKIELANNRYVVTQHKPRLVSAIGAVHKSNGGIRLIHDASRPYGGAINDFWEKEEFRYQSIQDAVSKVSQNCYMAKLDLQSAYRSVKLHNSNFPYTGLKWLFAGETQPRYLIDTRLPFGARRAPYIFHHLTQSVCRMMLKHGFHGVIAFLDDFLILEESKEKCLAGLQTLMGLVRKLGFSINYDKLEMPTTRLDFLGITLDTERMTLELPQKKLVDLESELQTLRSRERCTKKQLQRVVGKLNFACSCIYGGKFFLRRLYDSISKLHKPWHRTRVTRAMLLDIEWWLCFLHKFNGLMPMIDPRPLVPIFTDSSSVAAGAVFGNNFIHVPWTKWPGCEKLHINFKEMIAVEIALTHWAPYLANHTVHVHVDNTAAVGMLNKRTSRNPRAMQSLRNIFWLSTLYNFRLNVEYIPGSSNVRADLASRLHDPKIVARCGVEITPVVYSL